MHAGGKFVDDFPVPEKMPEVDPDGEDHLSIPLARAAAPGKPSAREAIQDDDDDCQVLDVIDTCPLKYALPMVPGPAVATKRAETRKRAVSETAHVGGSGAAEKKSKTTKHPGDKPPRRRKGPPTVSSGYAILPLSCSILVLPEILSNMHLIAERRSMFLSPLVPVSRGPGLLVQPGLPLHHLGVERRTLVSLTPVLS